MDNLQDKISSILSDPEAMEQIKNLGSMLGLDSSAAPASAAPPPAQTPPPAQGQAQNGLAGLFSNAETMSMMTRIIPLLQNLNNEDETTRLLDALAPFLSEERGRKLEQAKQLMRLLKLLPLLKNSGIFGF